MKTSALSQFQTPLTRIGGRGSAKASLVLTLLFGRQWGALNPKEGVKNAYVAALSKHFSGDLDVLPIHFNGQGIQGALYTSLPNQRLTDMGFSLADADIQKSGRPMADICGRYFRPIF